MPKERLPKQIFVRWENVGTEDAYLSVFNSAEDACEQGETHEIGVYELREIKTGSLTPKFK